VVFEAIYLWRGSSTIATVGHWTIAVGIIGGLLACSVCADRQHLPLRDFVLGRDGDLLAPLDAWSAAAMQLRGTQAGYDGELKHIHVDGTFHQSGPHKR
jgi:hypothetical protein